MLPPTLLFDFWAAFDIIITIALFIGVFNWLYPELLSSKLLATLVTATVIFLLVVPFAWFRYLLFVYFFMYAFFWEFQPWKWGKRVTEKESDAEDAHRKKLIRGYPHHGVFD